MKLIDLIRNNEIERELKASHGITAQVKGIVMLGGDGGQQSLAMRIWQGEESYRLVVDLGDGDAGDVKHVAGLVAAKLGRV